MHIQQAIEQLEELLAGLIGPSHSNKKKEQLFLLSLWKFLQHLSNQYSSLLVLPIIERENCRCDAILLSHGGVYVFHLLPPMMIEMDITSAGIKAVYSESVSDSEHGEECSNDLTREILYSFGNSSRILESIQFQLGWAPLPVYEFYIASEEHQDNRCVVDGKLIISITQLDDLYGHYEFRSNSEIAKYQKELYEYLLQTPVVSGPAMDNPQSSNKLARDSVEPGTSEISMLPPRQSRKKKHSSSWLNKLMRQSINKGIK